MFVLDFFFACSPFVWLDWQGDCKSIVDCRLAMICLSDDGDKIKGCDIHTHANINNISNMTNRFDIIIAITNYILTIFHWQRFTIVRSDMVC